MIEEVQNQLRVEVGHHDCRWCLADLRLDKTQQEPERIPIGGDGTRADGSVVSRKSKTARSRGGLEKLSMNPGDTVVVPEIIDKTTLLRGLTDWSAVFGQFGLGAAAINVLR